MDENLLKIDRSVELSGLLEKKILKNLRNSQMSLMNAPLALEKNSFLSWLRVSKIDFQLIKWSDQCTTFEYYFPS